MSSACPEGGKPPIHRRTYFTAALRGMCAGAETTVTFLNSFFVFLSDKQLISGIFGTPHVLHAAVFEKFFILGIDKPDIIVYLVDVS